jgi:Fe-S-cluster containining protein
MSYVYLDRREARQLRGLGLPVLQAALGDYYLELQPHEGAGGCPACTALQGKVGEQCECVIYENRPTVCRNFEAGSDLCREAREQAGLPV